MPRQRLLVPLRWSDMDAYGHVNNVQFLRLLEEARVLLMAAGRGLGKASEGLVVARTEIEYLMPLVYRPEPIAVDVWMTRVGGGDFDLGYEVLDPPGGEDDLGRVYVRAESTLVPYDLVAERPRRLQPAEVTELETLRDTAVRWRRRRRR